MIHDCSLCTNNCFSAVRDANTSIDSFKYNPKVYSQPNSLLLGLTNRCNLQCKYCFVQQNEQEMPLEIAEKAIQWIKSYNEKPTIGFFGGEPLLKFEDLIKPLVIKYKNEVEFTITTNGVLLNEDIVDFFTEYKVYPLLSFDGVPQVQNYQRSNSFKDVLRNIPYLLLRFPETTMRATITKESIPYIYDTILMAEELGFKSIFFCENAFEDWDDSDEEKLKEQVRKIGLLLYNRLMNNQTIINIQPLQRLFRSIELYNNNSLHFNNDIIRCGLGTTSCAVTPTGDIIPCQEKLANPTIILGNVNNGINFDIHKNFLIDYFNKVNNIVCDRGCSERDQLICLSHLCPSRLEDLNFKLSSSICIFNRTWTKTAGRLYALCANSDKLNIREYFGEDENENDKWQN